MQIELIDIGKKYEGHKWIFRHFNGVFLPSKRYGIAGPNGSGKTTMLKIIAGYLTPTEGTVNYSDSQVKISRDFIYHYINVSAPNENLISEFSLIEMIRFHFRFKRYLPGWTEESFLDFIQLSEHRNKRLSEFSSGMLQRLKLAMCCASQGLIYLLDEPTSFLDQASIDWYYRLLGQTETMDRIVVISSNIHEDFTNCDEIINIQAV